MTTNASVTTHDWPVAVIEVDHPEFTDDGPIGVGALEQLALAHLNGKVKQRLQKVIPPNTPGVPHDVCLWQGRTIMLVELPKPS
jgi:hypothetical protein